jgi:hypothetical protein
MPDWLSRSSQNKEASQVDQVFASEIVQHSRAVVENNPLTDVNLIKIQEASRTDPDFTQLKKWVHEGFPLSKKKMGGELTKYWALRHDLSEQSGLLIYKQRVIIPATPPELRQEMLRRLHEGHTSLSSMRARAQRAVYWPGLATQLAEVVDSSNECNKNSSPHREPLVPLELPNYPWQKVALDVADIKGRQYLVIVNYFSRYPEVFPLNNLSIASIINACKETFSRHGTPKPSAATTLDRSSVLNLLNL